MRITEATPNAATATHCPYCALQCAMTLTPAPDGRLEVGGRDFPTNAGGLCRKGWTSASLLSSPERLTTPLLRGTDGDLHPASWDDALDRVAADLATVRAEHGADGVAVFGGGGLTNEKAYLLGRFARVVLGTRYIDYNGRFCMSSAAAAGNRVLGLDRGLPSRSPTSVGPGPCCCSGATSPRPCPPRSVTWPARGRRGGSSSSTRDARRPPP